MTDFSEYDDKTSGAKTQEITWPWVTFTS